MGDMPAGTASPKPQAKPGVPAGTVQLSTPKESDLDPRRRLLLLSRRPFVILNKRGASRA
ncbi:MAG: hypothetical protein MAG453_00567 [Calditrichaeota bacterium]|nr:hypothetical protein [Calditrichota bacterium]